MTRLYPHLQAPSTAPKRAEPTPAATSHPVAPPARDIDTLEAAAAAAVNAGASARRAALAQADQAKQAHAMSQVASANARRDGNYEALKALEASPQGQALMRFMQIAEKSYPKQFVTLDFMQEPRMGNFALALTSQGFQVHKDYWYFHDPVVKPLKTLFHGVHEAVRLVDLKTVRARFEEALAQMTASASTGVPPPEFGVHPLEWRNHVVHHLPLQLKPQQTLDEVRRID